MRLAMGPCGRERYPSDGRPGAYCCVLRGWASTGGTPLNSSGIADADYLDDLVAHMGIDTKILHSELFDAVRGDLEFAAAVNETREQATRRIQSERARF